MTGGLAKMRTHLALTAMALMMALLACSVPNDNIIVPGERVGKIVISRTKARDIGPGDGSISPAITDLGISLGLDIHLRVSSIEVRKPNFQTISGLKVGSTEDEVKSVNGYRPESELPLLSGGRRIGTLATRVLSYPGIDFVLDANHHVAAILVAKK
jgi:hypothetical protein